MNGRIKSAVLLFSVLLMVGCSGGAARGGPTPTPFPTPLVPANPTYEVQRGDVTDDLQFTGRVAPVIEEDLFFRASGYVETVYVGRDDIVQEGDILAELETTDLRNQLAQVEAELEVIQLSSERRLAEAQAGLNDAEWQLAQLVIHSPDPQVSIAEANLERARLALVDAQEEHQHALDRPWEPAVVREGTAAALRQAELSYQIAQAEYDMAIQAQDAYYYDVQMQQQRVDLAQLAVEEIEIGADVQTAQLGVQRLEDLIAEAQLVAPFDGQILSVNAREGRSVEAYNDVMIIADMSSLEISADLDDDEMEDLVEGMVVVMAANNRPGEQFTGEIRVLPYPYGGGGRDSVSAEGDRSTRITFDDDPADLDLEIGDAWQVTVVIEQREDVLWLPPEAIRTFEGRDFVLVQSADGQQRVNVTLGIESDERVEILDGLSEGQIVVGP